MKAKRMNINVPSTLHAQFKAATAAQGKRMTDVLIEFIREYVDKYALGDKAHKERLSTD